MTKIKIKPWILNLPEYIPGGTIEDVKKKYNLKEVYKLASNENILGPSPKVLEFFKSGFEDVKYYPDSYCRQLREKLSYKLGVEQESIIFGNGTDHVIEMVCDAILDDKKNIIVPNPTFLTYEKSALKNNAKIIKVPLVNYKQDVKSIVKSINKDTAIIFLTSPHNPTGTIISSNDLEFILNNVSNDILIVLDEAYIEFVLDKDKINSIKYLNKFDNLFIMRTFSKIYGIAGLRIGYGVGNKDLILNISKLMQPFVVNSIAQIAAAISLDDEENINKNIKIIVNEREKIFKIFDNENIEYVKSHSNFILVKTGINTNELIEDLLKNGFMVRNGDFLGFPEYIRFSISLPEINEKFINLFISLYKKYV